MCGEMSATERHNRRQVGPVHEEVICFRHGGRFAPGTIAESRVTQCDMVVYRLQPAQNQLVTGSRRQPRAGRRMRRGRGDVVYRVLGYRLARTADKAVDQCCFDKEINCFHGSIMRISTVYCDA